MVRAKFSVIEKSPGDKGLVTLMAVYSGSEENKKFFELTPNGRISLDTVNPEVFAQFELGKEYYVDFTPAEYYSISAWSDL
jgi:hypothetical protein